MVFTHCSVRFCAKPDHDIAQHTVIHVLTALPDHLSRIDPQLIALLDMVVQKRRQQIVGRCDRMKIAGKMQVQILHRHDLGVTAACRAALDAKARSKRRLS